MAADSEQVWFVTGASRGIGASITKAALAAGHRVVATARNPEQAAAELDDHPNIFVVRLDVTSVEESQTAVALALEHFGRIDVLVNNAGSSFKGYFEEMSPEQVRRQLDTNLIGPMNTTRAVLPVMRNQRSGHIITISSGAGLMGFEYSSVYAASKFGVEGWMSALGREVELFGIHTTVVNPGFFRTGLASPESIVWPDVEVADYSERSAHQRTWWQSQDGEQPGDPEKLAAAIIEIASETPPPRRFIAGRDVIALAERKIEELRADIESHRDLSSSLDFEP